MGNAERFGAVFKTENKIKLGIISKKSPDGSDSKASFNKQTMQHITSKQLYEKLGLEAHDRS